MKPSINESEYIEDVIQTNNLLLSSTKTILLQAIDDFLHSSIDIKTLSGIAHYLNYIYNEPQTVYLHDQELGSILEDISEINIPKVNPPIDINKTISRAKQYFKNNSHTVL